MALTLTITNAGRAAIVNAQHTGTAPVTIAQIGLTATNFAATPAHTALPGEHRRLATVSGGVVAPDVIHVMARDESANVYTVRGFALYLADGTLFALYGQAAVILEKSAGALMLLATDIQFADIAASAITFGDANWLNPPATETVQGVVELATPAEAVAGVDAVRAVTPAGVRAALLSSSAGYLPLTGGALTGFLRVGLGVGSVYLMPGTPDHTGYIDFRNAADIRQGYVGFQNAGGAILLAADGATGYVTNKDFDVNGSLRRHGYQVWDAGGDGAGSGLDADLLDGQQGAWYADIPSRLGFAPLNAATYTAADVRAKLLQVDGAGSGVDADLLDGQQGSYYTDVAGRLGYTPVRQGGGSGQLGNIIHIGLSPLGRIKAQVDSTDFGNIVCDSNIADVWRATNDGAGSGLDADLLDGLQATDFVRIAGSTMSGPLRVGAAGHVMLATGDAVNSGYIEFRTAATRLGYIGYGTAGAPLTLAAEAADGWAVIGALRISGALSRGGQQVWDAGNDGAGSGLDADLLDGQQGSYYSNIPARLGYTPLDSAAYTAADVRAKLVTVDGAGSGVDADLLDGYQAAQLLPTADLADNGWCRLPNGLILQWGRINAAANAYSTITYPIAFPSACFHINCNAATEVGNTAAADNGPLAVSTTTTSATLWSASNAVNAWWFAIGI